MKNRLATLSANLIVIILVTLASGPASAMQISPVSYDMKNGGTGLYQFWDDKYSETGSSIANYTQLSGGLGDLTDGVIADKSWFVTEKPLGAGPYVGWSTFDPTIKFNFEETVNLNSLTLFLDDPVNAYGGVRLPVSVTLVMGGVTVNYLVVDPLTSIPIPVIFSDLGLSGDTLTMTLNRKNNTGWVFLSEVVFDGSPFVSQSLATASVPEPGTMLLLGAGLFGLACYNKRRRGGN